MRRVREILCHRHEQGLGHKAIAIRVGAAPSTVRETLRRAEAAGLVWPLDAALGDAALEAALYRSAGTKTGHRRCPEPDWATVHRELQRKHVTLQIVLRLLTSLRTRTVSASLVLRQLSATPRQSGLVQALLQMGRIERTLFTLDWIGDEQLRRGTTTELNKGERRNGLVRAVNLHRLGRFRDRSQDSLAIRASALNLVVTVSAL